MIENLGPPSICSVREEDLMGVELLEGQVGQPKLLRAVHLLQLESVQEDVTCTPQSPCLLCDAYGSVVTVQARPFHEWMVSM